MADESEVALGGEVLEDELVGAVVEDEVVLLLVVPHLPGSSVPLCASNVAVCRRDVCANSNRVTSRRTCRVNSKNLVSRRQA